MATARVSRKGSSHFLGLPWPFHFKARSIEMVREGDEVVLGYRTRNRAKRRGLPVRRPFKSRLPKRRNKRLAKLSLARHGSRAMFV